MLKTMFRALKGYGRSRKGSVTMSFGLMGAAIVGINVVAVEYSRGVNVRAEMQRKLDATMIYLSKGDRRYSPQEPGETYIDRAIAEATFELEEYDAQFTWSEEDASITGVIDFTPSTIIAGGFFDGFAMQVRSRVSPRMLGLVEISLVLDSSGSMLFDVDDADSDSEAPHGQRRIDALQTAVSELFDSIYENPSVTPKVAVIPYANTVDISDLWVNGNSGDFRPTAGRSSNSLQLGIIDPEDVEMYDQNHSDPMRRKGIWATERWQSRSGGGFNLSIAPPTTSSTLIPITSQRYTEERCSYYSGCYLRARRWIGDYRRRGGYYFPHQGVLGQTTESDDVRAFVQNMKPKGGTAGHIGAAWGLYALLPQWHSVFNHPAGQPGALDSDEKHLVIMTDGQFNSPQTVGMSDDDIFDYFQSVCDLAAASNVTVYTVGLLLQSDQMDQVLGNCVTHPNRYYKVDSRQELIDAFRSIGRVTSQVRISM